MGYIAKEDLIPARVSNQKAVRLFSDKALPGDPEPADINTAILNPIIERVSDLMDGYFRKRYNTPVTPVSDDIKDCCCDLVVYEGYKRSDGAAIPESVQKQRDQAVKWLEQVSKGIVNLGQNPQPSENSNRKISFTTNERVFTKDRML